jgi:hypothetical protein
MSEMICSPAQSIHEVELWIIEDTPGPNEPSRLGSPKYETTQIGPSIPPHSRSKNWALR